MNIDEAQLRASTCIKDILDKHRVPLGPLEALFRPPGYKPKIEICMPDGRDARQLRKKRPDAPLDSFNPRIDKLILSFEPTANRSSVPVPTRVGSDISARELEQAALTLLQAEDSNQPFVGLKFFRDRLLSQASPAWAASESDRRTVLEALLHSSWVLTGKMPNPQTPDFPVTTIKLNRDHPAVQAILAAGPKTVFSGFRPVKQTGDPASLMLTRDRL